MTEADVRLVAALAIFVAVNLLVVVLVLLPLAYGEKIARILDATSRMFDSLAGALRARADELDARRALRQTPRPKAPTVVKGFGR